MWGNERPNDEDKDLGDRCAGLSNNEERMYMRRRLSLGLLPLRPLLSRLVD